MKRFFTLLLALLMVVSMIPLTMPADALTVGMRKLEAGEEYTKMSASQMIIDVIKDFEGFRATPYADNGQWSIGYGSYCGDASKPKPNLTLTRAQAEERLRKDLARTYEPVVNNYCKSIGRQPSQQQFDALLDLTYNVGGSWTTGTAVTKVLKNPTDELAVVRGFGAYCRSGGDYSYVHMNRRIREALMFVYGEYYLAYGNQDCRSNLKVVTNDNLPHFKAVVLKTSSGTFSNGRSKTVQYYMQGEYFGSFPEPERSGYTLVGWEVTKRNNKSVSGGEEVNIYSKVSCNMELTALWKKGVFEVAPPQKPSDYTPFIDVPDNSWYTPAVAYVYENNLMNGTTSITFNPEGEMTRAMLVTVLYRMSGSPKVTDTQRQCFTDIAGSWYTDAVAWAYANNIVSGVTATTFEPDAVITRQDAVTIFYRYCVEYNLTTLRSGDHLAAFSDTDCVAPYALEAFNWAVGAGLINGIKWNGSYHLNPLDNLNRAQSAVMLQRCDQTILK